ncbi:unnamed protein product [Lampetra planeri]
MASQRALFCSSLGVATCIFIFVSLQVADELSGYERASLPGGRRVRPRADGDSLGGPRADDAVRLRPRPRHGSRVVSREAQLDAGDARYPVIVWWTPLTGEAGKLARCPGVPGDCFFTVDRSYRRHSMARAFLFYGTDFSAWDLPLPRQHSHDWALFHEESPKNNYVLFWPQTAALFNHTATFSRRSDLPLTLQFVESAKALLSRRLLVGAAKKSRLRRPAPAGRGLAAVAYVQSDCEPPSDRDEFVRELSAYMDVDSYGRCLHNRDLPGPLTDPSAMEAEGFLSLLASYKFVLALENALCDDYVTEKLWRPLVVGAVPVYRGSASARDWLPDPERSAIIVSDFPSPKELASFLLSLDADDALYDDYRRWKLEGRVRNARLLTALSRRPWGVNDPAQDNFIDAFECAVCARVWENEERHQQGLPRREWSTDPAALSCPAPSPFRPALSEPGGAAAAAGAEGRVRRGGRRRSAAPPQAGSVVREFWLPMHRQSEREAEALHTLVLHNRNYTEAQFYARAMRGKV